MLALLIHYALLAKLDILEIRVILVTVTIMNLTQVLSHVRSVHLLYLTAMSVPIPHNVHLVQLVMRDHCAILARFLDIFLQVVLLLVLLVLIIVILVITQVLVLFVLHHIVGQLAHNVKQDIIMPTMSVHPVMK